MRGEPFIYPAAAAALVRDRLRDAEAPECPLTPREAEIVALVAEALSSRQIAERLSISVKTVDRHRANIMQKLGMSDRVELTRYAIRHGLVDA
jgi:DNA-binding NarL/FixJ family response regulator